MKPRTTLEYVAYHLALSARNDHISSEAFEREFEWNVLSYNLDPVKLRELYQVELVKRCLLD